MVRLPHAWSTKADPSRTRGGPSEQTRGERGALLTGRTYPPRMERSAGGLSLGAWFDPRDNSLNLIRVGLALMVIVSHSWPLGGFGDDPRLGGMTLGEWAVAGFFAMSGWLITGSRLRVKLLPFVKQRFFRIYPGLLVSLLVVAFALAPLSAVIQGTTYPVEGAVQYVVRNLAVRITEEGIPGTLMDVPWGWAWNGSTWTLWHEVLCYVAVAGAVTVVPRRMLSAFLLACWGVLTVVRFGVGAESGGEVLITARFLLFFLSGSVLYLFRDRVPASPAWAAAAIAVAAGGVALGNASAVAGLPIAYLMIWLGAALRGIRLARVHDFSYGLYIYAFPVQHLLYLAGMARYGVLAFAVATAIATTPFAVASWFVVERPALRRSRRRTGTRSHDMVRA